VLAKKVEKNFPLFPNFFRVRPEIWKILLGRGCSGSGLDQSACRRNGDQKRKEKNKEER
jgi:hypothetical protein